MELRIGAQEWLTVTSVVKAIEPGSTIMLHPDTAPRVKASFVYLQDRVSERIPVYGVNTQFGDQVRMFNNEVHDLTEEEYFERIRRQQFDLIRSHACGVGPPVCPDIVRLTMLLRAHCLAKGYSGVHIGCVELILSFLEKGLTPSVRRYGSIGASGDLIPLAMIARACIGDPVQVVAQGERTTADKAMKTCGLEPLEVHLREGTALVNGTSFMTAIACLALYRLKRLFDQTVSAIGMALEALRVVETAYEDLPHKLKNSAYQRKLAERFRDSWNGSELVERHHEYRNRVGTDNRVPDGGAGLGLQDIYSVRSVCHGLAPFCEALDIAETWIEQEINSVNDNPIVDPEGKDIYESANFMGYNVAQGCELLTAQVAGCSAWIHALVGNLLHPRKNKGLPANLSEDPVRYSGFRPAQLLACSLAVQNRSLAQHFQSFMIPTEGDNQDVNSLGTHSALNLWDSVENMYSITSILILIASQALELRGLDKAGMQGRRCVDQVRGIAAAMRSDRPLKDDIDAVRLALENREILCRKDPQE